MKYYLYYKNKFGKGIYTLEKIGKDITIQKPIIEVKGQNKDITLKEICESEEIDYI